MNIPKESPFDQLVFEEGLKKGVVEETQRLILRLGQIRFGPPDAPTRTAVEALKDLERLSERLLDVSSWAELLAEP
jgi:hypothetical protein